MLKYFLTISVSVSFLMLFLGNLTSQEEDQTGKTNKEIKTIVIDAGHGGKDPGAIAIDGTYEKDINLPVALKLRDLLLQGYNDVEVVMTRDDDRFIELHERGRIANENGGNLFVSIHSNSKKVDDLEEKTGFELYLLDLVRKERATELTQQENVYLKGSEPSAVSDFFVASLMESSNLRVAHRLANILKTEIVKGTPLKNNGVKQDAFVVLYGASMPAVLVECGFLTNQKDTDYLKSEKGQYEIANAIYKGIRFFKYDYDYENSLR
ncbi:MAG: N-acetylmuramoyl-L-alanine amidase [Ignavibacteriae bacterium]|nr:N-acetylmuramoyl-L-alanine amidase [Ignavibacteriota bacterium]MCB9243117.1 N-acetylmuramoyl-L-alanine amidase [Ignavibacteriales bacterium]